MSNRSFSVDATESQRLLNQIVLEHLRDKRRKRFWRWIIRFIVLALLIWVGINMLMTRSELLAARAKEHVGLIDINGEISDRPSASSSDTLMKGLEKAYENKSMKALILRINSPGGSPVQADYMFNAIRYFRKEHQDIKIYAVCVDTCASAAYYIAAAADEIYANPASMVGSIGVIYNGFGFVDTLQKVGVTRRLQTAGSNKGFLDQFSPENPQQQQLLQTMLNQIHQQFIARVKEGRGERLHIDDETFSGLIWTGTQAKEKGLIDGFASSGQLARDIIKIKSMVDYTSKPNVLEQMATNVGSTMIGQLPDALGFHAGFR